MPENSTPISAHLPTHAIVVAERDHSDAIFSGPVTSATRRPDGWYLEVQTIAGLMWAPATRCYAATPEELSTNQTIIEFRLGGGRMSIGPRDMYLAILSTLLGRDVRMAPVDQLVSTINKHGLYRVCEVHVMGFSVEIDLEWVSDRTTRRRQEIPTIRG